MVTKFSGPKAENKIRRKGDRKQCRKRAAKGGLVSSS